MATFEGDNVESIVHKVAYIFDPSDDEDGETFSGAADNTETPGSTRKSRKHGRAEEHPTLRLKKQRSSRNKLNGDTKEGRVDEHRYEDSLSAFPTLFQGRESPEGVARRRQLYSSIWTKLHSRIQASRGARQTELQRSNQATLSSVMDFIERPIQSKIPAAFVILGPAATTDMLLFRQLATSLADSEHEINRTTEADDRQIDRCVRCMVRLRAAEAPNLRAALKTIVQTAATKTAPGTTNGGGDVPDEEDVVAHNGRKYLAYDLEAVATAIGSDASSTASSRIVVAFEDSEAFDTALLADLLSFLHSWLDRIPFVLLFGVATSVDLFQARLPKQVAHRLTAAQFDVAPSSAVLDRLVRCAVAAADVPLRLGPWLLRSLAERQDEQVTGVSVFVNSLKYAYMCYFYANPLSVFLQDVGNSSETTTQDTYLQDRDYLTAIRQLPSFRRHVEELIVKGHYGAAKQLLDDGDAQRHPLRQAVAEQLLYQRSWNKQLARALHVAWVSGVFARQSFTELYITALEDRRSSNDQSFSLDDDDTSLAATMTKYIRRLSSSELVALARRLAVAIQAGDPDLALSAQPADTDEILDKEDPDEIHWASLPSTLMSIADQIVKLQAELEISHAKRAKQRFMFIKPASNSGPFSPGSGGGGNLPQLRSKYTAHNKVLRTTVVAQKVQLSRDSMALTEEDQAFTELVDATVNAITSVVDIEPAAGNGTSAVQLQSSRNQLWLQEIWLYDARMPYRDVFIPRPNVVVERALARPHDYLACACCADTGTAKTMTSKADRHMAESIKPTMPATSILYQLYLEAGPLINVADLWDAFQTAVSNSSNQSNKEELQVVKKSKNNGRINDDGENTENEDSQERRHLVQFYQSLSELKTLGFIKPTRRKVDHVAKIKWL
ncbi:Origin recognition complex subunit 3 [Sporothrix epigloea]|uniref:Origin recognition complex subunit 3 n=1 Tax=Sporothrix epigloea TaxID=1892477 RepID=A0ABP0DD17_9PEZI